MPSYLCHFLGLLCFLMILDYLSGLLRAIYTKQINSQIGYKEILKKAGMILAIFTMAGVDYLDIFNDQICFTTIIVTFFVANEVLSIFENLSALGIKLPQSIRDFFEKKQK